MPFTICGLNPVIEDPTINLTYDEVVRLSDKQFEAFVAHMRGTLLKLWDEQGIAPTRGWTPWEVRDEFKQLSDFPTHEMWYKDDLTGRRVIYNTHTLGNAVNAWTIGQMLKTRINYTEDGDKGRSIYDFFAKDELFKRYLPYARRHILRDSFYFFAQSVPHGVALPHRPQLTPSSPLEYVRAFAEHERPYGTHEILIEPKKTDVVYTGYAGKLNTAGALTDTFQALSYDELIQAVKDKVLPKHTVRLIDASKHLNRDHAFHIRLYETGQRIFPRMFASFRISMCQYAVNFPPLVAKALYDEFVPAGGRIVWDPSSGWAGRILGAMASKHVLNYIGTDPNPAFYDGTTSMYAEVAKFYLNIREGQDLFADFDEQRSGIVYQHGSENFNEHPAYQAAAGHGDLVFSSPPYFNREAYSEDERQSYKKFGSYALWRDGFLRPTIQNAYNFLGHQRYFLWNIADLKVGKGYLPLEQDSMAIAQELGFQFKETILMALKSMPGANRMDAEGTATAKNMCKILGRTMKFEPVHVFYKG